MSDRNKKIEEWADRDRAEYLARMEAENKRMSKALHAIDGNRVRAIPEWSVALSGTKTNTAVTIDRAVIAEALEMMDNEAMLSARFGIRSGRVRDALRGILK